MNWRLLAKMLGWLAIIIGVSMTASVPWAFAMPDWLGPADDFEVRGLTAVLVSILICLAVGFLLLYFGRKADGMILQKEALAVVGLGWMLAGLLGALPFWLGNCQSEPGVSMDFADGLFESVSGFTTTGASVLNELEDPELLPRCIMFWRCFTHWLGGMGIIVLFVAILGHLGASGKAIMRREVPGPINESVRPRVQETATMMWKIYVGLSAILVAIFLMEGMSVYDALCHSFGTMATGGFSTYNSSVGHFKSVTIELTIALFMIFAGTNFSLFYAVIKGQSKGPRQKWWQRLEPLYHDPEWRTYMSILGLATIALTWNLVWTEIYGIGEALRHSLFLTVAIMTTTGFGTEDFSQWSEFSKGLLLLLMFIGGSAGSTSGGIKVIRFMLWFRIIKLEIERAFRPNVVRTLRIGDQTVDNNLRHDVVVYFSLVLFIYVSSWMTLAAIEPDTQWLLDDVDITSEKLIDCASAVAATLNNIGPGLGVLGPAENFSGFSFQGKLLLTLLMLLGRLELFAILVLFFPPFWKSQ